MDNLVVKWANGSGGCDRVEYNLLEDNTMSALVSDKLLFLTFEGPETVQVVNPRPKEVNEAEAVQSGQSRG